MSVIAVRNGIIAADTGGSGGGLKWPMSKLERQGDIAIGWAGDWTDGKVFAEWYFNGRNPDRLPTFHNREGHKIPVDFTALVLTPGGWEYWFEWMVPETNKDTTLEFMAIGSGNMAAMAAMQMGADAVKAVEIACAVARGCELPVEHEAIP